METWECVEVCPHCDSENILQWNTEIQGFVAKCQHCGKKMMLCDECQHEYDAEKDEFVFVDNCDWCNDADGVCFRDTSPVVLTTYGHYEEKGDSQYELNFEVPKNWLWSWVKENGYKSIDDFLITYTWDTAMDTYARAIEDRVIVNKWDV